MKTETQEDIERLSMMLTEAKSLILKLTRDHDVERVVEVVRAQHRRIDELEEADATSQREYGILEGRLGEWQYYFENDLVDPSEIYEFLEDIGFDPNELPQSLGERRAIRQILEAARMFK